MNTAVLTSYRSSLFMRQLHIQRVKLALGLPKSCMCKISKKVPKYLRLQTWLTRLYKTVPSKYLAFTLGGSVIASRFLTVNLEQSNLQPLLTFPAVPNTSKHKKIETTVLQRMYKSLVETILILCRGIRLTITFVPILILYPVTFIGPRSSNAWYILLRLAVECSGATFIKLGQWASTRQDLFTDEFCFQMRKLQRRAPFHGWEVTRRRLKRAFGGNRWKDILVRIERVPHGSGAVAQAYKAWMKPDTIADEELLMSILEDQEDDSDIDIDPFEVIGLRGWNRSDDDDDLSEETDKPPPETEGLVPVCVKVLHPGIFAKVTRDLCLLRWTARFIELVMPRFRWLSLTDCVDEFSNLMLGQMDLRCEADNLEKFVSNFEDVACVRFPRPIRPYVKKDVLIETWEDAEPISNFMKDNSEMENIHCIRSRLANLGIEALLQMVFIDNLVHGDLHPGNIMVQNASLYHPEEEVKINVVDLMDTIMVNVLQKESPMKLVFLDVGISVSLKDEDRRNFKKVFTAIVCGDGARVADLMLEHSQYNECKNVGNFKSEMADLVNEARKESLKLGKFQVQELLGKVFSILMQHKVKMESNFVQVIIAIMVLEGLGRSLDPDLDIIEKAKPILLGGYR